MPAAMQRLLPAPPTTTNVPPAVLRCCAFGVTGARAARALLICRCVAAVPQVCTPCSAAESPDPNVLPRAHRDANARVLRPIRAEMTENETI